MIHSDRKADDNWFKRLFDLSPDPTWIIEGNQFVDCNEAAVRTLGYKGREELLKVHPSKLSPPTQPDGQDSYAKAEHMMATAKAKGLHRFEWVHTKAGGASIQAEVTLSASELGARKVIYCVWRDITERKKAEDARRQSEERHRAILQTAMDGFWLTDAEGHLLEVNEAYCKMSGYSEQELLGMRIADLEAQEKPEDIASRIKRIMERGEDRFDSRHKSKDGRILDVEVSVQYRLDEGGRFVVFLRDITERKRVQAALQSSEYVYRTIVGSAPEGVWMIGPDRRTTEVSERMCRLIGYAREEMLGRNPVEFADEDNQKVFQEKARLAPNQQTRAYQVALRHRDGRNIPTEFRATNLFNPDGSVLGVLAFVTDLTDRKRAEQALSESEARFRTLVEWSPEPLIVHRGLTILYANPAAITLFGADSPGNLANRSILDLVHPAFHQSWLNRLENLAEHGVEAPMMERKLLRLDGTVIDAEVQGTSIVYNGEPAIHIAIRDITESKRAERELRSFRVAMDATEDGIYIVDRASMRFVDINAGACTMLGLAREAVLAAGPEGVLLMSGEQLAQIYDGVISSGGVPAPVEMLRTRRDGKQAWVEIRRHAKRIGEQWIIVTVARDITERKQAEEQMKHLSQRLLLATSSAQLGVWDWNVRENTMAWNDRMFELYGVIRDTFSSNIDAWMNGLHPEDKETAIAECQAALNGECEFDTTFRVRHPDGRVKHLKANGLVLCSADGKAERMIGINADITESKEAEAERVQLEAQLRESQKMEALGTLAGGVAHDFNNALAAIIGNTELARQDVGPSHLALESLEEIGKASRRAKDLVQQILAFGRRQTLERKPTALALIVVESARLLRSTLPTGVSLIVDCKADTPVVLADAAQVKQILLNLYNNALQAMQDQLRPGVIEVRLEPCTLGVARSNLRPGRYACFAVRDNGPGMDEVTRTRIFEPFFTTKPKGKGTGLGLAVVHGIVQSHEAHIEVQSTLGEGSEFRIYFPATDTPVSEVTASAPSPAPVHGKGKHVLYVDDEEAIIFLMKRLLERQGFGFSGYTDPQEALAVARSNPGQFDLAVTDYNMPGMSGLEVASALREIRADLPILMASGYITEELRVKAPEAGVSELIYKPNTADDLCEAVARYANAQSREKPSP